PWNHSVTSSPASLNDCAALSACTIRPWPPGLPSPCSLITTIAYFVISLLLIVDGVDELGEQAAPPRVIGFAQVWAARSQPLPAAMRNPHARRARINRAKANVHFGRIRAVLAQVPHIRQPVGWLPEGNFTPVVFLSAARSFEESSADPGFEHNLESAFA